MSSSPLVSIVIPSYACANSIPAVLEGLKRQTYSPLEILVVNDCSPDHLEEVLAPFRDQIRYLKNPHNLGLSKTYNQGLRAAQGEYVLTLHSDCVLEPDYIARLVAHLTADPKLGAATGRCRYVNFDELGFNEQLFTLLNRLYVDWRESDTVEEVPFIEGKADLFRRETLERYGYFNETLRLTSEDQDLSAKMRRDGLRLIQDNACVFTVHYNQTQDSLIKVLRKQRSYAAGQAYVLLTYGSHAVKTSTAARNHRAMHRFLQLLTAGVLTGSLVLGLFQTAFLWVAFAVLVMRGAEYFLYNRPLPLGKRMLASAIGLAADFFYTTGLIEGTIKTLFKKKV
ncbi:MAG: hypothetical protein B9S32_11460 [Verrucomicrobia bacterium Tous-C9LFEB]|nr:MAG: hypothetical protein B9S32_11460 [Verrucomicrobia bacterium Tous-C9LFEB]